MHTANGEPSKPISVKYRGSKYSFTKIIMEAEPEVGGKTPETTGNKLTRETKNWKRRSVSYFSRNVHCNKT